MVGREKRLLTPREVAKGIFMGHISEKTLAMWRWKRKGPPYLRLGGKVFYFEDEVRKWIEDQRVVRR